MSHGFTSTLVTRRRIRALEAAPSAEPLSALQHPAATSHGLVGYYVYG